MKSYADKNQEKSDSVVQGRSKTRQHTDVTFHFADNRAVALAQRKLATAMHDSPMQTAQRQQIDTLSGVAKPLTSLDGDRLQTQEASGVSQQKAGAGRRHNHTGMPDRLKAGVERLSGMDLSDVRVHSNSPKPAQLNALAYARGNQIHLGPGQEKHLPHEAWHVVQQRQGRVRPTVQLAGVTVNDDKGLEREADVMGERALHLRSRLNDCPPSTDAKKQVLEVEAPLHGMLEVAQMQPTGKLQDSEIEKRKVSDVVSAFKANLKKSTPQHNQKAIKILKDKTSNYDKAPVVFRCFANVSQKEAEDIVASGSVSGEFRGKGDGTSDALTKARQAFASEYAEKPEKLAKDAMAHKANKHGSSNFVSTTTDEKYSYATDWASIYRGKEQVVLAIAVVPTNEKIYNSRQLAESSGGGFGVSSESGDYESEILFGGGIMPDSIIWAMIIPY